MRALICLSLLVLPALAEPPPRPAFDLDALRAAIEQPLAEPPPRLAVLVSFAMPAASLRRLARDAGTLGAPLLLRGLRDNSMRATLQAVTQIDEAGAANWLVEPRLFQELRVAGVPLFVLEDGDERLLVRGDVALAYALERMAARSHPLAPAAHAQLERLRSLTSE